MTRTSGSETVRWDSDSPETPPEGYGGVQLGLGKPLSELTIDSCGRIMNRKNFFPSPPSNTGDLMVVPLPDDPVTVGTFWTVPDTVVVDLPEGARKSVRTRLRYQVAQLDDDRAIIKVDTTVLTPIHDTQTESRLLERIWSGQITFDIVRGCVLKRSVSVDRRVVGFHGPASSIRYKASRKEQLVSDSLRLKYVAGIRGGVKTRGDCLNRLARRLQLGESLDQRPMLHLQVQYLNEMSSIYGRFSQLQEP